jgi:hypothetical protein
MFPRVVGISSGTDDLLAAATATALDAASDGIKQLARAGSISGQRASAWRKEGKGNPLYDLNLVVYRLTVMGQHPGAILASLHAAMNQGLLGLSDDQLVDRFWALSRGESEKEARENTASALFAQTGDLEELERAGLAEAGVEMERAAVCRELRRRSIDPRDDRWK